MSQFNVSPEDFVGTKEIYDVTMADNVDLHDLIYPRVFGPDQYIGQFSDNSRDELEIMGTLMNLPKNAFALDVGCGRGNIAAHMASRFNWDVTGIDLSEIPINQAKARYESREDLKIRFKQGSIYDLSSNTGFDGIYGTGAFCHFDSKKLFSHCHSLLKHQGTLAFMERIRVGEIGVSDWDKLTTQWCCPYVYSSDEYKELLIQNGFQIEHELNLTEPFKIWQSRSVTCREELKDTIVAKSSESYYQQSLDFAKYENDVTESGALGYICLVAKKV